MKWKTILKAPMPLDSREKRNEDYKQAIIAYEKDTIEPKLTEYIRSQPALESAPILIGFAKDSSDHEKIGNTTNNSLYFLIDLPSVTELGGNMEYIVNTIGELYDTEGYKVGNNVTFNSMPAVKIEQPY